MNQVQNGTGNDVQVRLAAARERKARREQAEDLAKAERELKLLEIEEQYAEELGAVHEAFEVVDGGAEGPIVLKLGESVLHKRFNAKLDEHKVKRGGGDGITPEACHQFIAPCVVFPTKELFNEIVERRPGLLYDCAGALLGLYGRNEAGVRGK